jgi:ADP-ribose pyrophosphatase
MKKLIPENASLLPGPAERVFKGVIFDIYHWPQRMFDGSVEIFEMLKRPDTVIVVPVVDRQILIVEDVQPSRPMRLSFPGGRVDKSDSSTLMAAQREIKEETGYEFNDWKIVNVWQPHKKMEWFVYIYIAWNAHKTSEPHFDTGEKIKTKLLPFDEAKALVISKIDYLGDTREIFESAYDTEDIIKYPEFQGPEIEC